MNTATCFATSGSGAANRSHQPSPIQFADAPAQDGTSTAGEMAASHLWHVRGILREDLIAAAAALDLPTQALVRELPGRSLAEIATARGLDPMVVADALFARALLAITRGVDAELISAEQSIDMAQRARERIGWRVNWHVPYASQSALADVG